MAVPSSCLLHLVVLLRKSFSGILVPMAFYSQLRAIREKRELGLLLMIWSGVLFQETITVGHTPPEVGELMAVRDWFDEWVDCSIMVGSFDGFCENGKLGGS